MNPNKSQKQARKVEQRDNYAATNVSDSMLIIGGLRRWWPEGDVALRWGGGYDVAMWWRWMRCYDGVGVAMAL